MSNSHIPKTNRLLRQERLRRGARDYCGSCNRPVRNSGLCCYCRRKGRRYEPERPRDVVIYQSRADGLFRGTDFYEGTMNCIGACKSPREILDILSPDSILPDAWETAP